MAVIPASSRGGQGTVTGVTATDPSIVITGTATVPTVATGTLDVIATQHPPVASVALNSQKITGLLDPTGAQDASSKNYVDTQFSAVNPAVAVTIATTAVGDTSGLTYLNGAAGIGATFTGSVNTPLTIDGVTLTSVNQRVLVKNDTQAPSGSKNGIYYLTQLQTGILPPILTRALDYDQPSDINNTGAIPVVSGTANAGTSWLLTSTVATIGTDPLTFIQFSYAATASANAVLTTTGDLLYASAANTLARRAVGSGAQVLGVSGGLPAWVAQLVASVFGRTGAVVAATNDYTDAQVQNSPTNVLTATGDLLYASAANTLARRAIGSTGNVLTVTGGLPTWAAPAGGAGGLAVYGDGNDGTQTFDGAATILGVAPSSNVYTQNRDWFFAAATINSGVTIKTNGYRIFCAGALTNNGTIQWNGNAAAVNAAGTTLSNNSSTFNQSTSSPGAAPGQQGGPGGTTTGTAGSNQTGNASFGGVGGTGGNGTSGNGAAGGTVAAAGGNVSPPRWLSAALAASGPQVVGANVAFTGLSGGSGGGGGGGDGTAGGGGGGGGGVVMVAAKTFAGTGAVQARGGAGGIPAAGNRGGGGGGGGGVVVVVSSSVSAGAISGQTIDANGGALGTATGSGTNGAAGGNGTAILLAN